MKVTPVLPSVATKAGFVCDIKACCMVKTICRCLLWLPGLSIFIACSGGDQSGDNGKHTVRSAKGAGTGRNDTYGYDAAFLNKHLPANTIELKSADGSAKVLLSADYQARVMTSTAGGDSGNSYGWINYGLIEAGKKKSQFNPFGGEERCWIGPEGGQYSLYFKKGDSFAIRHWQVPAVIDTLSWQVVKADSSKASFTKQAVLTNYSGTEFPVTIRRSIRLLNKAELRDKIKTSLPEGIKSVAYETESSLENAGQTEWKKEKGLLSIWLLGMMKPSPGTVVIIPFFPRKNIHSYITDDYFGKVPADRLLVKDSVLYFNCDGKHRSKIGLSPAIAKSVIGSYDFNKNILTLIYFSVDKNGLYSNSKWEIQRQPYKGDAANAYNDGPLADGTQMGPFYEIESSSPVRELKKGEAETYSQTTCHLEGEYVAMRGLARQLLGVDLDEARTAILK